MQDGEDGKGAMLDAPKRVLDLMHSAGGLAGPGSAARDIVEQTVALAFRVPVCELRARTRRKARIAFARQVAMYLTHVACGLTLTEVGDLFDRDRTTVAHACGLVEDRRDDPGFDLSMDQLETAICIFSRASAMLRPAFRHD